MFCQNCGSHIPDGSKFCSECGAPAPEPPVTKPDYGSIDYPDYPNTEVPEQAPAEPAAPAWQQPAASYSDPTPSYSDPEAANSSGWSIPSGNGGSSPYSTRTSDRSSWDPDRTASKNSAPVTKRWWFWLIIVLLIAAVAAAAAATLLRAKPASEPVVTTPAASTDGGLRAGAAGLSDAVQAKADAPTADEIELPETAEAAEPAEPEAPAADDGAASSDSIAADFDRQLTDAGISHEIEVDEDGWITVYIWHDGIDELTDLAAIDGDEDALAQWADDVEYMRQLSEDISDALFENGLYDASGLVGIQDDLDYDIVLAYAMDGEVVYDWVNDIDLFGLSEE